MEIKDGRFEKINEYKYAMKGKINIPLLNAEREVTMAFIEKDKSGWIFFPYIERTLFDTTISLDLDGLKKVVKFMEGLE